jgi:nitrate reductase gamma subunit
VLTNFYAVLFYLATFSLVGGLGIRIYQFASTPAPLKIPIASAPKTRRGVVFRMFREVVFFQTLFKSNKWIWLFGMLFHAGLLLVVLRHLRYFTQPVWFWVELIQPIGIYAGFAMLIGLIGLLLRRMVLTAIRYISAPSDYLMLVLLIAIGASGYSMKFVSHTDIVAVKQFFLGLMGFEWQPIPPDLPLLIHLSLVAILMIIFPFSKLLHAPGIFFSPTLYQVDNAREKRHIVAWAADLEK